MLSKATYKYIYVPQIAKKTYRNNGLQIKLYIRALVNAICYINIK